MTKRAAPMAKRVVQTSFLLMARSGPPRPVDGWPHEYLDDDERAYLEAIYDGFCAAAKRKSDGPSANYLAQPSPTWRDLASSFVKKTLHDLCGFKEDTIRLLEQSDELERVWIHIFGLSPNSHWPSHLVCADLLKRFLTEQLERLGRRHERVLKYMDTQGKVDWGRAMPYKVSWTTSRYGIRIVDSLEHMSGAKVNIANRHIPSWATVEEGWDDSKAYFAAIGEMQLARCFDRQAPFRKFWDSMFFEQESGRLFKERHWRKVKKIKAGSTAGNGPGCDQSGQGPEKEEK